MRRRKLTGGDRRAADDGGAQAPGVTVLVDELHGNPAGDGADRQTTHRPRRRRPLQARPRGTASEPEAPDDGSGVRAAAEASREGSTSASSARGRLWLRGLLAEPAPRDHADAERQAAQALRESATPAMQQLVLNVPGTSTPEEAEELLAQRAGLGRDVPVEAVPSIFVELRNPPEMAAYPGREKLSNRVLRLATRRSTTDQPSRRQAVSETRAVVEQEWAQRPTGTQRCQAVHGSDRCSGVFAYHADEQTSGAVLLCPRCDAAHRWDPSEMEWVVDPTAALAPGGTTDT